MKSDILLNTQPSKEALAALSTQILLANQFTTKSAAELELDSLATIDPALHGIAKDILAQVKYSFIAVASGQTAGSGNEFVELHRNFIAARKPTTRASYARVANLLLAAPTATRQTHFAQYASIAPGTFVTLNRATLNQRATPMTSIAGARILENLQKLELPNAFVLAVEDTEAAAEEAEARKQQVAKDQAAQKKHDAAVKNMAEGLKFKRLEFFISEVRCHAGTGDTIFSPADEIALGGVAVGATGITHKIKQFMVKEGFSADSGFNDKKYVHGRQFFEYNVVTDKPWPHEYTVTLAMAEIDSGGFGDFLVALWDKVSSAVGLALAELGGTLAGAVGLSFIPGLGTLIGALFGAIIGWLVSLFHNGDDILGSSTRRLRLKHLTKFYYDRCGLTSRKGLPVTMSFQKGGGNYQVWGGWRLIHP